MTAKITKQTTNVNPAAEFHRTSIGGRPIHYTTDAALTAGRPPFTAHVPGDFVMAFIPDQGSRSKNAALARKTVRSIPAALEALATVPA